MARTDADIQQAVLHELKWDTRVDETDVGVEVDAGVVTLTGTVNAGPSVLQRKRRPTVSQECSTSQTTFT